MSATYLGVSPVLLERYMGAAGKVSALAVGDPDMAPERDLPHPAGCSRTSISKDMPIGTVGGILAKVTLPARRRVRFHGAMFRTNLGVTRGLEYEHEIEYTVDGRRVHMFKMGGEDDFKANLVNMTKLGDDDRRARPRSHFH